MHVEGHLMTQHFADLITPPHLTSLNFTLPTTVTARI